MRNKKSRVSSQIILFFLFTLLLTSCRNDSSSPNPAYLKIQPNEDFFLSINGNWLDENDIPADKSTWGSFEKLAEDVKSDIKGLIDKIVQNDKNLTTENNNPNIKKIRNLYLSIFNEDLVANQGLDIISDLVDKVTLIENSDDLVQVMGELQKINVRTPFGMYIGGDKKNSKYNTVYLAQSGLALPDRSYYIEENEVNTKMRQAYKDYIKGVFNIVSGNNFTADNGDDVANSIYSLESELAKLSWTRIDSRNNDKIYNPYTRGQWSTLMPSMNWDKWTNAAELNSMQRMIVMQPTFFIGLDGLLHNPLLLNTWKDYLLITLIDRFAAYLNPEYVKLHFNFHSKAIQGIDKMLPRWKFALAAVENQMGMALGELYIKEYFPPQAEQKMSLLVENLKLAFNDSIANLDWMDKETKLKAQEKLEKMITKIGRPEEWKDYTKLAIEADRPIENIRRGDLFNYREEVSKEGKEVDKKEWHMTPQTVNAYFNPVNNEIVFPAAILRPPFFDMDRDDAYNYGAIGAVIGHEMGHAFDDQGAKYDGDGQLNNWWSDNDLKRFKELTKKLVEQYDNYTVLDDLHVKGEFTLGENIGDLTGVNLALRAYNKSLRGEKSPQIDHLTGPQRYFIGWAKVWARKYRDNELRRRIHSDPHSPANFRANGPLSNMPEFYEAFNVQKGDGMYKEPEDRIKIW